MTPTLCIQQPPKDKILNRDEGIVLLGCLIKSVCDTIVPANGVGGTGSDTV